MKPNSAQTPTQIVEIEEQNQKQVHANMYNQNSLNYTNACINNSTISRLKDIRRNT
jgi:hypothetical protein